MKPYFPPKFEKFGENIRKLLKEKFDYTHAFKVSGGKQADGVTVETQVDLNRNGSIIAKKEFPRYEVQVKGATSPDGETSYTLTVPRLYEGLRGTVTAFGRPATATKQNLASTKFEYVRPNFSATSELKTNGNDHTINTTASVGIDNIAVGGQIAVAAGGASEVTDYNLGIDYTHIDSVASIWTESQADVAVFNYYHLIKPTNAVGVQFKVEIAGKHSTQLTLANEYKVDPNTTVKSKLEFPSGVLSTAFEHKLSNPKIKFNVAASFTPAKFATKPVSADKFGIGMSYGDF